MALEFLARWLLHFWNACHRGPGPKLGSWARAKDPPSIFQKFPFSQCTRSPSQRVRPMQSKPITTLTLFSVTLFLSLSGAKAEPIDANDIRVIDGDTVKVYHQQPNVRLVGFNAPETRHAACTAEADLGAKATRRLRDLIRAGNLDFIYVRCSCPPATQGTFACNYGRDCGTLKSNGRDVGTILIEEGLAVPFICNADRCPRTPRPWCN
jgi:endonuclease YncB( thermonuclease family)